MRSMVSKWRKSQRSSLVIGEDMKNREQRWSNKRYWFTKTKNCKKRTNFWNKN
jgi:hypothetical protein